MANLQSHLKSLKKQFPESFCTCTKVIISPDALWGCVTEQNWRVGGSASFNL